MKKSQKLILLGLVLLGLSASFGIYSNAVYDSAQCISSFEGQNSLVCRAGGSSTATTVLQGLFIIGLVTVVVGAMQYFRERKAR